MEYRWGSAGAISLTGRGNRGGFPHGGTFGERVFCHAHTERTGIQLDDAGTAHPLCHSLHGLLCRGNQERVHQGISAPHYG